MPTNRNRNYKRGYEKERRIVNEARDRGCIAFRSAGSHSPIDVAIIDYNNAEIKLIQCKSTKKLKGGIEPKLKEKLERELGFLNGTYTVRFMAL